MLRENKPYSPNDGATWWFTMVDSINIHHSLKYPNKGTLRLIWTDIVLSFGYVTPKLSGHVPNWISCIWIQRKNGRILKLWNTGCLMAGFLLILASWFLKETHTWVVFHPPVALFHCSIWIQRGWNQTTMTSSHLEVPKRDWSSLRSSSKNSRGVLDVLEVSRPPTWWVSDDFARNLGIQGSLPHHWIFYSSPCQIYDTPYFSSWWFQPLWKILVKMGRFLKLGWKYKIFETTT